LPLTMGRFSFLGPGQSVGLLTTTGARSGQSRTTPLQFVKDGERVLLVASAGGSPKDPAWAHNLRAHPACTFLHGGRYRTYTARETSGEERTGAWARVVDWYQGYAQYQSLTSRLIPVFILEPSPEDPSSAASPSAGASGSTASPSATASGSTASSEATASGSTGSSEATAAEEPSHDPPPGA
jgi:deazaflavin-dependent oxidoreductase (nitroreductase family)